MRRALVLAILLAACSRGSARDRTGAESAAVAHEHAHADLATAPAPLSCRALDGCTSSCADAACAEACVRRLSPSARPAYEALQACVVPACAHADGGAAPCSAP